MVGIPPRLLGPAYCRPVSKTAVYHISETPAAGRAARLIIHQTAELGYIRECFTDILLCAYPRPHYWCMSERSADGRPTAENACACIYVHPTYLHRLSIWWESWCCSNCHQTKVRNPNLLEKIYSKWERKVYDQRSSGLYFRDRSETSQLLKLRMVIRDCFFFLLYRTLFCGCISDISVTGMYMLNISAWCIFETYDAS